MTNAVSIAQSGSNNQTFRNRIINGAMTIDQRNNGAAVTAPPAGGYTLDRWFSEENTDGAATIQQISDAPSGFSNSLRFTVTTADASLGATQGCEILQNIEGFNTFDLAFGTASAQPITLSFWVKSSLTGTFGGALRNSAYTRSYPYTYTISAANTWEYKTVTIPGDTTGTWIGATNGAGLRVGFGLGIGSTFSGTAGAWAGSNFASATGATNVMGTLSATWQVTGVQLEEGTAASPFENRLYGTELALCQRYFCKTYQQGSTPGSTGSGQLGSLFAVQPNANSYPWLGTWSYPVVMRSSPTVTLYRPSDGVINGFNGDSGSFLGATATALGERSVGIFGNNVSIGLTTFMSIHATASAEL